MLNSKVARRRGEIIRRLREFFYSRDYLETETPILCPYLLPEPTIDMFRTDYTSPLGDVHTDAEAERHLWLAPSPELWMKRILSHYDTDRIFQISRAFRNGESLGAYHQPEFTMLGWYTRPGTYHDSLDITRDLLEYLLPLAAAEERPSLTPPGIWLSMEEAFWQYAGIKLDALQDLEALRGTVSASFPQLSRGDLADDDWETLFNRLFLSLVEPQLPRDRPVFLADYPSKLETFAKPGKEETCAERWELYLRGIETANCFSELLDKEALEVIFSRYQGEHIDHRLPYTVDSDLPHLFPAGSAPVSGVALGVDRLIMLLTGCKSIDEVIFYPVSGYIKG